jgi:hypothetical protein
VEAGAAAARRGVSVPICTELTFVFVVPVLVLVPVVVPVVVVVVLGMVTEVFGVVRVVVWLVVVEVLEGRGTFTPLMMMVAMSGPWITTS